MFCPRCGNPVADDAKFCPSCGTAVHASAPTAPSVLNVTEYAGFWRRFLAYLIDGFVLFIPSMLLFFLVGWGDLDYWEEFAYADDTQVFFSLFGTMFKLAILGELMKWLYEAIMVSSTAQATLGKMAIGIIVTDESGKRISFARATGRYFAKYLSGLFLGIGYIMAAFTAKKQALHDMLASCLVVRKRELHITS